MDSISVITVFTDMCVCVNSHVLNVSEAYREKVYVTDNLN